MSNQDNYKNNEIITKLITIKEDLPSKQKKLCNYMVENYEHIGIMTIKELAKAANVGTTTVTRVVKKLNYDGYNDLKKDFHKASVKTKSTTWWHLKKSIESKETTNAAIQVWQEVASLLGKTMNESFIEAFTQTVKVMNEARRINILGLRSSKVPAKYLEYLLKEFSSNINQISNDVEFLYDRLLQIEQDELLIIFVHSPFTVQSIEAAKYCHEHGINVILVTDLMSCPIIPYADIVLKVQASNQQYSIVPTITLIEALVIEYGRYNSDYSIAHLEKLGKVLSENNITTSHNLNLNFKKG